MSTNEFVSPLGEGNLPITLEAVQPANVISLTELIIERQVEQATERANTQERRRNPFRNACISSYLIARTAIDELKEGTQRASTKKEAATLWATTGVALGGQVYERARGPEVFGVSLTAGIYRNAIENGMNSGLATGLAATALGSFVYAQQKIIGRNFVKTAEHFPETYDSVNQMWPKTIEAIQEAIPSKDNRVGEAIGMVGLGTTPFIASARVSNPEISAEELRAIERRVTRRGSVGAGVLGAAVLGAKSSAVHLPARAGEIAVDVTDKIVDIASSPSWVIAIFGGWAVVKNGTKALITRRNSQKSLS